jgi:glutamate--cysteine ligase
MPTFDPQAILDRDAALALVGERALPALPAHGDPLRLAVGLEPERLVVAVDVEGRPSGRWRLEGPGGVLEALDDYASRGGSPSRAAARDLGPPAVGPSTTSTADWLRPRDPDLHPPLFELTQGGSLTFEPGAQVEHSTAVHRTASAALDDVRDVGARLEEVFAERQGALVSLGLDPWHGPGEVPQQLRADRYRSMAAYFDRRGTAGPWMMRLSGSLQVNVDLGAGLDRSERWWLANLLSPALVASFSTSPERPGQARQHCRRAQVWQALDPTRTGFPRDLLEGRDEDPAKSYAAAALEADVLLFRDGQGGATIGQPGFRFADWLTQGHPHHGWPTAEDLHYHLTTLFFEVRARGFLELRGIDALPPCGQVAAVAFVTGLLYDRRARGQALERLLERRSELQSRWQQAAESGYGVPGLRAEVEFLWRLALEGAERLGASYLRAEHLAEAWAYAERFPLVGRAPADELREVGVDGPAAELRWALAGGCRSAV